MRRPAVPSFRTLAAGVLMACAIAFAPPRSRAAESPFAGHPAAAELERVFAAQAAVRGFAPTGLTRRDYLKLMSDDIDFWKHHQNDAGAIIDPYTEGERQYSTPAFALAASLLVTDAGREDLLERATRAMTWATSSLAAGKAADSHGDFFIPMLIHARRLLKSRVPAQTLQRWDRDLRSIVPTKIYNMGLKQMNWNIVSSSGELLRRQDGLVAGNLRDAQWAYLEHRLADHQEHFTRFGMYADPGYPLAYDEFARLWLDDMMACGAYDGAAAARLREILDAGALSGLLLLSPSGEWPCGGRSSHHNWNEAQTVAVCEIHARQWRQRGKLRIAGAFKRAAHLAFRSMMRWQRPSGELWIIKNRFEPEKRFAFERYSNHSQYNTLPMAMLALAYEHADESVAEAPMPAEVGGYVFDLRDPFHKVVAAAGGYYVEIDTAGDPHYNATGLQRVHRAGVDFPPLSDTAVAHREYGAKDGDGQTLAPGIQWREAGSAEDQWQSLGTATLPDKHKPIEKQIGAVRDVMLTVDSTSPAKVSFALEWTIVGANGADRKVQERYAVSSSGVECTSSLIGGPAPTQTRVLLPALVFDGIEKSKIRIDQDRATIEHRGSSMVWTIASESAKPERTGPPVPAHTGLLQALVADLPGAPRSAKWTITLAQKQPADRKAGRGDSASSRPSEPKMPKPVQDRTDTEANHGNVFRPGALWPDTDGVPINAHGGGIYYEDGTFYWFGEFKTASRRGNTAQVGVSVYSSTDLYHWTNRGIALHVVEDDPASDLARGCVLERPKVIRNPRTGKYVMWFHLELKGHGYHSARSGVAVADHVTGPYRYLESFRPNGQMARDMTLFVDDDGKAYQLFASEENQTMRVSLLRDDYLAPSGTEKRIFIGRSTEAPAICKYRGRYWFIGSGCTGWKPNAARAAVADSIWGPWTELGNPCVGPGAELTFNSQGTFILPVPDRPGAFIFMADRWRPENAIDGRYVWLPIEFEKDHLVLRWHDQWDLSVFNSPGDPQLSEKNP